MQRLSGLDALSLHAETKTMTSHATAIMLLDPSGTELDSAALRGLLAERIPGARQFRLRIVEKPLDLGQPVFVEDPAFDVDHHLHRATVPSPGGPREVTELLSEIHRHALERSRPLWEAWVLDGLADGHLAVALKISHAVTDGVGGVTSLLPQLLTTDPEADVEVSETPPADPLPSQAALVSDLVRESVGNTLAGVRMAGQVAPRVVRGIVGRLIHSTPSSAPPDHVPPARDPRLRQAPARTRLNLPLTDRRSTAYAGVPLASLREPATAFGVSVNDVYIAACTTALRVWLDKNDSIPDEPLQAFMPINTRSGPEDDAPNSWSMALVRLPGFIGDPVARLRQIHLATHRVKSTRGSHGPKLDFADVMQLVPPLAIQSAASFYMGHELSRRHAPAFHTCCSNIPGPREQLWLGGARVVGLHSCAPLFEGSNLNITAVSHGGRFDIGISACPDNVPEVWEVADAWVSGIEELVELARDMRSVEAPHV